MIGGQDEVEVVNEEVAPDAAPAPQNDIIMNDCIDNESEDSGIESEDEFDEEFVDRMVISEGVM